MDGVWRLNLAVAPKLFSFGILKFIQIICCLKKNCRSHKRGTSAGRQSGRERFWWFWWMSSFAWTFSVRKLEVTFGATHKLKIDSVYSVDSQTRPVRGIAQKLFESPLASFNLVAPIEEEPFVEKSASARGHHPPKIGYFKYWLSKKWKLIDLMTIDSFIKTLPTSAFEERKARLALSDRVSAWRACGSLSASSTNLAILLF